jgi:hypothetical protein
MSSLPVVGFEGLYEITDDGRVLSLRTWKWLRPGMDGRGYKIVCLYINSKGHTKKIHRLVAIAHIPNPENYPVVNHVNGIKTDNNTYNLEWCSYSHDRKHAFRIGLRSNNNQKKPVIATNIKNGETIYFESIFQAMNNGFDAGNIYLSLSGKTKHAYGYVWSYAEK